MVSAVEVRGLTKHYGELLAVDHVSFQVDKGEIFGFLGPNGAGKTTTQRMLTGVLAPTDGEASVMGYDIQREAFYAKRLMGVVPELSNVYIDLSPLDNLMLMAELYGVPRHRRMERAAQLLRTFELFERKREKTKGLSKGMRQRLLLCMALVHEPRILFADEPTAGMDVQSARTIRDLLRRMNGNGVTIFLTTHNIEEANQLCSRIAIIDHGKIATIDSPENLRAAFQSVQSVEVVFDPPLETTNLLEGIPSVDEAKRLGDKFRLYTDDPTAVVSELMDLAKTNGLEILSLSTLGPSLEDVFVKITEEHEGWNYSQ